MTLIAEPQRESFRRATEPLRNTSWSRTVLSRTDLGECPAQTSIMADAGIIEVRRDVGREVFGVGVDQSRQDRELLDGSGRDQARKAAMMSAPS